MNDQLNQIKENASLVISECGPLSGMPEFGLNRDSLVWVEGYIEHRRHQPEFDASAVSKLIGSFLGECLIGAAGGGWHWSETQQAWGVSFANDTQAFPFAKVTKLFANGLEAGDSIVSFYDIAVKYLVTGKLSDGSFGSAGEPPNPPHAP